MKLRLTLVGLLALLLGIAIASSAAQAAPALQLPWPTGTEHRIYGGDTYGCGFHTASSQYAIDFQFQTGEYVAAVASGEVSVAQPIVIDIRGKFIEVNHGNGYKSRYLHLQNSDPWPAGIGVGEPVDQGEVIAYSGGSGGVAPHLHFDLKLNGSAHKPEPMSGLNGFGWYGYSLESGQVPPSNGCLANGNIHDPSPYWSSWPPSVRCDFDGDGYEDLGVGIPGETIGSLADAGAAHALYGGSGSGLSATGDQLWYQNSPGIQGGSEAGDSFGAAVACGDFDSDGFDDLAIGVPLENVTGGNDAGAINVIYGFDDDGLDAADDQQWWQGNEGVKGGAEANDHFGAALAACDFDGDGFDDLAVGVPDENIGSIIDAGAVNVLYGSPDPNGGLTASGDQQWHQDSSGITNLAEAGDSFGEALACGDFNGDSYDDLAVGVPGEGVGSMVDAGAVHVIYGSVSGLTVSGDELWHQNSVGIKGGSEANDQFGAALAVCDFDGDGKDDLAIGVPLENVTGGTDAGVVNVIYGAAGGLTDVGDQMWWQGNEGIMGGAEANDHFGAALACGDFDGDGKDDLAVGVPLENVTGGTDAGVINVIYGSGTGLTAIGDQMWWQGNEGIKGGAQANDHFGAALAVCDFDGDGKDDLAVGVPDENIGSIIDAGAVNVIYGSGNGLSATGDQLWHQNVDGIVNLAEADDNFGGALAASCR